MTRSTVFKSSLLCAFLAVSGSGFAASTRSTPAIEQMFSQAQGAIDSASYTQATQLLTSLTNMPEHVHSQRALELLGNVRESNGQMAHALAEYRRYLEKYPDGPGVNRVRARVNAILKGAAPTPSPVPPAATADAESSATSGAKPASTPVRTAAAPRTPRPARPAPQANTSASALALAATGFEVTDRGRLSLTYRYNEQSVVISDLTPAPGALDDEEFNFDNALTTALYFNRIMENDDKRISLTFSGAVDLDFAEDDGPGYRLYEASAELTDKGSGRVMTFGRFRLKPTGIAYRLDGAAVKFPTAAGPVIGLFAGGVVQSTRDMPFEDGRYLVGASATYEGIIGEKSELSIYALEQRDGAFTDRRALGAAFKLNRDWGGIYANAEYDFLLNEVNRVVATGTKVFADRSRLTGRVSYYHSPALSLRNALIGQTETTLDDLSLVYSQSELEQLAADRSAEVTSLGVNYYRKLNDTWDLSLDGTFYHTSGKPASGGVDAVAADGTRIYLGARATGSSIFMDRDRIDVGLRYSHSDSSDLYVFDTSARLPVADALSLRPRLRVGYRDNAADGDEVFVMPSINANYKFNRDTSFQLEAGGQWTKETTSSSVIDSSNLFISAGLSRSF